jgi:single-stranded DNA-binding protein
MTAFALILGRLFGEPVTRPTRAGGQFTAFKLRVTNGNAVEWWSVTTFSDAAREELADLREGDALAAVGTLEVGMYQKNGETRIAHRLTADRITALKPTPKSSKPKPDQSHAASAPARTGTRPIDPAAIARRAARNGPATADGPRAPLPPFDDGIPC